MSETPGAPPVLGAGPLSSVDQERLAEACRCALGWHGRQLRKQTDIPYVSHLLVVGGLVLEHGGSVDQAIAGILHDVVEDTAGTLDDVRRHFGDEVARIVDGCTDAAKDERDEVARQGPDARLADWRTRKEAYIRHLRGADPAVALVAACDKRHNLGTIVRALRHPTGEHGHYMDRFTAPASHQIWYYAQLVDALDAKVPGPLHAELHELLGELQRLLPDAAEEAVRLDPA